MASQCSLGFSNPTMDCENLSRTALFHITSFLFLYFYSHTALCSSYDVDASKSGSLRNYIVLVRQPRDLVLSTPEEFEQWHISLLASTASSVVPRFLHSYDTVLNGFAATLTDEEVGTISKAEWFVHAYPSGRHALQTTRTPSFMGLHSGGGLWNISDQGKGIIIGLVDTGVMPNHTCFDDIGMPPPPARWKGSCEFKHNECNNKLIGARSFVRLPSSGTEGIKYESPTDYRGHGTFTASVIAGRLVESTSALGLAQGAAVGIAPLAHLAVYKVCGKPQRYCADEDILMGINAAVRDGVDVLSISMGSPEDPFYIDPIAIGAFGAIRKGILVSKSAGNYGPELSTIGGSAPWLLTVAASTIDRRFTATVRLGNGMQFDGQSSCQHDNSASMMLPLVYPGRNGDPNATACADERMGGVDVKGKIVLCEGGGILKGYPSSVARAAGAVGLILMNDKNHAYSTYAQNHQLPASNIDHKAGLKIKAYIASTKSPVAAIIFKGTITGRVRAPEIPSFSSRGPSKLHPGILKPDIAGPGVGILGAWPVPISFEDADIPRYIIQSGTSLACPHLGGIAAMLKSVHPDWSPAMIKSAIMTTAYTMDGTGRPIVDETRGPASYFAMGAGHMDPTKAFDPGLVYDIKPNDYVRYVCGLGYNHPMIAAIRQHHIDCWTYGSIRESELNYPSITVLFSSKADKITIRRTVTNVGKARSTFWPDIELPHEVYVVVEPKRLSFTKLREEKTFTLTFKHSRDGNVTKMAQGQLKWVSTKHIVRSPISIVFD